MARVWDKFLTERDKQVFEAAGYSQPMGLGSRPAVVVIDVTYAFCGDRAEPILDSIERFPNSCGEDAWRAIPHIGALCDAARARGVPVFYTVPTYRADGWDAGSWQFKQRGMTEAFAPNDRRNIDVNAVVAEIAPAPRDVIIEKLKPSGFHGTPLRALLQLLAVNSLIMAGTTTSGCVRATVIDAFSENYRIALAEEGCFDRSEASHAVNLMDMNAKYCDVRPTAELIAYLNSVRAGQFALPPGGT